jgi:hypothetical protein
MQSRFPSRSQPDMYVPPVAGLPAADDQSPFCHTVGQFHHAVMPQLEPGGQFPDSGTGCALPRHNRQQKLVLGRFETERPRRIFAKPQKTAELMPEFG